MILTLNSYPLLCELGVCRILCDVMHVHFLAWSCCFYFVFMERGRIDECHHWIGAGSEDGCEVGASEDGASKDGCEVTMIIGCLSIMRQHHCFVTIIVCNFYDPLVVCTLMNYVIWFTTVMQQSGIYGFQLMCHFDKWQNIRLGAMCCFA